MAFGKGFQSSRNRHRKRRIALDRAPNFELLESRVLLSVVSIHPQVTYAAGIMPDSVAVADLGNGHPDIVVANRISDTVGVYLGNGNGTFHAEITYATGGAPQSVVLADLGNGHVDIITANELSETVSVLLGNGNGTFQAVQNYDTGTGTYAVAVADLGNGHPDIVTANFGDSDVSVLLGNGDGTFQTQTTYATGHGAIAVALADLGNGNVDIVTANYTDNDVSVLLGNGDGTFQTQQTYAVGSAPEALAIADLGNGAMDIAVANSSGFDVSVLLGNGDGTFQTQTTYTVGSNPDAIAAGDLGNGTQDLVVANANGATVSVLQGNGDGTFQTQQTYATGTTPQGVAIADLGNGNPDIVVANSGDNNIGVLLNIDQYAPIGASGTITSTTIKGWAIDEDTPSDPATIQINIDGVNSGTVTADIARPDLLTLFGTEDHGFTFTMPTLTPGLHLVDVYALDTGTSAPHLIGSAELYTNQAPIGAFGTFNGSAIKGWAYDPNSGSSSIQIRYQIDGNAPVLATADVARSDLTPVVGSPDHGFAITLPQLSAGTHTVTVWAADAPSDALVLLGTRTAVVASPTGNPLPIGSVSIATSTTVVKGWAYDPSVPTTSIQVRIDIDGVAGTPFLANVSRSDLTPVIGSANHGFSQSLSLSAGAHRIDVYAIDSTTSTPVLLKSLIVGDTVPIGSFNPSITTTVSGWAYAGGLGGDPATVRVDVDGLPGSLTVANVDRPDLVSVVGGSDFGFIITLPKLLAGTHTLKVWVVDPDTLVKTLIGATSFVTT